VFNATFNNIAVIVEKLTVTSKRYSLSKIIKAGTIFKKKMYDEAQIIFISETTGPIGTKLCLVL
jgi:hypothetical protein